MSHAHAILTSTEAKNFILAGNATTTLRSKATGVRFTYRIRKSEDGAVYFVSVMTGPDNESNFQYLGTIRGGYYAHGRKSKISAEAPSQAAFSWAWHHLMQDSLHPSLEIWHEGRCGRCNRKLTVPSSIASGIGPECARQAGIQLEEVA